MLRFLQDLTGVPVLGIDLDDPETMWVLNLDTLGVTEEEIGTRRTLEFPSLVQICQADADRDQTKATT